MTACLFFFLQGWQWWNGPLPLVIFLLALGWLLFLEVLPVSLVVLAIRLALFFIVQHTHTCLPSWCNRKHYGRVSQRYRFESRRGQWALFSLTPSALTSFNLQKSMPWFEQSAKTLLTSFWPEKEKQFEDGLSGLQPSFQHYSDAC